MADRPKYGANTERSIFRHNPTTTPPAPIGQSTTIAPTEPAPMSGNAEQQPARKRQTVSTGSKTTVVLREDQIAALDDLTVQLRRQHQLLVPRTELIRVMVDALIGSQAHIDLADAASVDELRRMLTDRLRR